MCDLTLRVINPDGSDGGSTLDPQELELLDDTVKVLTRHPGFRRAYRGATVRQVECRRGAEIGAVVLRLQLETPEGMAWAFCARWGARSSVSMRRGVVAVARATL